MLKNKNLKGFTLLEILLVVAAIAILSGIVIFAVNPTKTMSDSRNATRRSDIRSILSAIYQYNISKGGVFPTAILVSTDCSSPALEICRTGATSCAGLTDLNTDLVGIKAEFLPAIPVDPSSSLSTNGSGYSVYKNPTTNRITVCALHTESNETISVTQ